MTDPISTTVGLVGAANGLIELTKTAISIAKKKNATELVDLIQDIREKAQDIREENLDLRHKIAELEKRLDIESKLEFDQNNLLWIAEDDKKQGPYCSQCKDSKGQLVRLHARPGDRGTFHQCPTCNAQPDIHTLRAFGDPIVRVNRSDRNNW
jgi:hypothetical protein